MSETVAMTSVPMGSWIGDLGAKAAELIETVEKLVEKYRPQAGKMLDASLELAGAVKEFVAAPSFTSAATLWHLLQAFPVPTFGACEAKAVAAGINWASLIQFAEAVAQIIAKFVK